MHNRHINCAETQINAWMTYILDDDDDDDGDDDDDWCFTATFVHKVG